MSEKLDFKVGADPELLLSDGEYAIHAPDVIRDARGSDIFGIDGGGELAEIRPVPDADPLKVVKNIKTAMSWGIDKYDIADLEWVAGSYPMGLSTGGHIHFGLAGMLRGRGLGWNDFVRTLDYYLAQPAICLEDKHEAQSRRLDAGYGNLSDHREQPHGLEYRTLSSWLTSPYIASGILCLAKAIVYEVLNHGLHKQLKNDLMPDSYEFNEANLDVFRAKVTDLWKDIRKFELYNKYDLQISFLKRLIDKRATWYPKCGLKLSWGIMNPNKNLMEMPRMMLESIWKE